MDLTQMCEPKRDQVHSDFEILDTEVFFTMKYLYL